jgi:LysR family transcriptional regulator, glycine cleavage system transcriptional activator
MREKKSPLEKAGLPPLNAVRAFEAAARCGSFAQAASDLGVTHWAVGKQIRSLEDWLGVPLFMRLPRGIALTDEGSELLGDVSAAFSRLSAATGKLVRLGSTRRVSGVVRINVPTSFALRWLIPRLPEFHAAFPNIEIRISTSSRRLRYIGSAFDLGVRLNRDPGSRLKFRVLMKDWLLPACSPEILRNRPVASVGDLRDHTLLHSATTRPAWSRWLAEAGGAGLTPARQIEFEHVHLQLQAAVDGLGIAIASVPLIERDVAAGRLICPILKPEWHAGEYLLISEARDESIATRTFRAWMIAAARRAASEKNRLHGEENR